MKQIYADNAATTQLSDHALQAMLPYWKENYGNPSSLHHVGQEAAKGLVKARQTIADALHCEAREIYFTSGGSEADNQALRSAARLGAEQGKRHIITTAFEHHAILHTLDQLEAEGFCITRLPVPENGCITAQAVANAIREDTCLVTIMTANNEIGTIQPIAEIGALCRTRGVLFHTDAVQAVGHIPVDVQAMQVDLLSLSGHKFHGPKGVGALYVRRGIPLYSLILGGGQERGKRAGTENIPAIVGMAAALQEACAHLVENQKRLLQMREQLIDGLLKIPHCVLDGDREQRLPGNVHVCIEGVEGESLLIMLDQKGICASAGSACTSGSLAPSHVLIAIGRAPEAAHGSLRLTLSETNTPAEVERLLQVIPETVASLRAMSPVWRELQEGKRRHVI